MHVHTQLYNYILHAQLYNVLAKQQNLPPMYVYITYYDEHKIMDMLCIQTH